MGIAKTVPIQTPNKSKTNLPNLQALKDRARVWVIQKRQIRYAHH